MGPVARRMLAKLIESVDGEAGFRSSGIALSAVRNGWVRYVAQSGRITFYAITPAGRDAFATRRIVRASQ